MLDDRETDSFICLSLAFRVLIPFPLLFVFSPSLEASKPYATKITSRYAKSTDNTTEEVPRLFLKDNAGQGQVNPFISSPIETTAKLPSSQLTIIEAVLGVSLVDELLSSGYNMVAQIRPHVLTQTTYEEPTRT